MCKKSLILSSSGLKNIIPDAIQEDNFNLFLENSQYARRKFLQNLFLQKFQKSINQILQSNLCAF